MIKKMTSLIFALVISAAVFSGCAKKESVLYGVIRYETYGEYIRIYVVTPVTDYDKVLLSQRKPENCEYEDGAVVKLTFEDTVMVRMYKDEYAYFNARPLKGEVLGKVQAIEKAGDDFSVTISKDGIEGEGDKLRILSDGGETKAEFPVTKKTDNSVTVTVKRNNFNMFFANFAKKTALAY